MQISKLYFALLTIVLLVPMNSALAQSRGGGAFSQQNNQQQIGIGAGSASPFANAGQSAFGGGQQGAQQGRGGQLGGQGANRNQQQRPVGGQDGFVGSDSDQVRTQQQNPRQQRRALFDLAVESLNEMRESRRERNARRNAPPPVRVHLRPLFGVATPNSSVMTSRLQSSLQRAMPASSSGTQISVQGSSATIQGSVASEYESKLAAKMVSMTPGIYQVNNQLTIQPQSSPAPNSLAPNQNP